MSRPPRAAVEPPPPPPPRPSREELLRGRILKRDGEIPDVVEGKAGWLQERRSAAKGTEIHFQDILSVDGTTAWVEIMVFWDDVLRMLLVADPDDVFRFYIKRPNADATARTGGLRPSIDRIEPVSVASRRG